MSAGRVSGHGFEGVQGLDRGISRGRSAGQLDGSIEVEAVGEVRTGNLLDADEGAQGHPVAVLVFDKKEVDAVLADAVFGFGLDVGFVEPAEAVEVVDVGSAQKGAHRGVDVVEGHAGLEHLVAVDLHETLGHAGPEGGDDGAISGRAVAAWTKRVVCSARYSGVLPARSWIIMVNPDPLPSPGMGGGRRQTPGPR
jgi:hypothetical protein